MLAIVIPYYKFTFFEATLESLASQTNQRCKVYIGDDASADNPSGLLEKYKGKFDFEYHRFKDNLGGTSLTKQWDRCIALSGNEEWIMILGDDDVLGENVVEEFYKNLPEIEKEGINVVRFSTQVIDKEGNALSRVFSHSKIEKSTTFLMRKLNRETRSSLSEYVFRKVEIYKYCFKDLPLGWYADDLAILQFSDFKNIFTINNAMISIRYTLDSLSGNQFNKKEKDRAKFIFFWTLYSKYSSRFVIDEKKFVKEKLINSLFNRMFLKHYFLIFFYSIKNISFDLFFLINIKFLTYIKYRMNNAK